MSKSRKILLVDNDGELGRTRCLVLQSHGFDAVCVTSIEQSEAIWKPTTYDLVLVDVQINPDAALELCEKLKKRDPNQLLALVSVHHVFVPDSSCPDEIIDSGEGPRRFISKIKDLLENHSSSATV